LIVDRRFGPKRHWLKLTVFGAAANRSFVFGMGFRVKVADRVEAAFVRDPVLRESIETGEV
jgi:hypothetical protein